MSENGFVRRILRVVPIPATCPATSLPARAQAPDPNAPGEDGLTGSDRELLAASRARMGFKTSQEA